MRNINNDAGFSLIEVLIAIAVLSIGMLSVAAMQMTAIKGNAKSNKMTNITTSSANQVEYLLNLPFNHALLTAGNHTPETDGVDSDGDGIIDEPDDDGSSIYSITWTVTDVSSVRKDLQITIIGTQYNETKTFRLSTVKLVYM